MAIKDAYKPYRIKTENKPAIKNKVKVDASNAGRIKKTRITSKKVIIRFKTKMLLFAMVLVIVLYEVKDYSFNINKNRK